MEIIIYKLEEIMYKTGYVIRKEYSDSCLNTYLNHWLFLEEKEREIQKLLGATLDKILYSKFYWCTMYKNRFSELYGRDVGIEQQQYKIIEEINQRVDDINWNFIQMIEEGNVNTRRES